MAGCTWLLVYLFYFVRLCQFLWVSILKPRQPFGWRLIDLSVYETYYLETFLKGYSPSDVAWIGSIQAFAQFSATLISGPVTDRYGAMVLNDNPTISLQNFADILLLLDRYLALFAALGSCYDAHKPLHRVLSISTMPGNTSWSLFGAYLCSSTVRCGSLLFQEASYGHVFCLNRIPYRWYYIPCHHDESSP